MTAAAGVVTKVKSGHEVATGPKTVRSNGTSAKRRSQRKPSDPALPAAELERQPKRSVALFSDVHSNLEALEAVLKDMQECGVTNRVCLGDVVGYNADPGACLDRLRDLGIPIIKGNHDAEAASGTDLAHYREVARLSMDYSRAQLTEEQKEYLRELPYVGRVGGFLVVHSSLFRPEDWFYMETPREAEYHFRHQPTQICFCGHTHVPRIFSKALKAKEELLTDVLLPQEGQRYLVNVGSVGQPRDGDPRASYAIYSYGDDLGSGRIDFRRVAYDCNKARKKIRRAGLPLMLGERLLVGT